MPLPASSLVLTVLVSNEYGHFSLLTSNESISGFEKNGDTILVDPAPAVRIVGAWAAAPSGLPSLFFVPVNPFEPTDGHISVKVSDSWGLTFSVVGKDVVCVDDQDCIF